MSKKHHETVSVRGRSGRPRGRDLVEVKLQISASGLSRLEIADYVRDAVESYKGCLDADDPCHTIAVEKVMTLGWVELDD